MRYSITLRAKNGRAFLPRTGDYQENPMAKGSFTTAGIGDTLALMMIRIPLGAIFLAHGSQKLLGLFGGHGLTATFQTFEQKMGIPPVLTFLAIIAEFGGGIGVLLGLLTRFSAAGIAVTMVVAMYKVTLVNGFFLNIACIPGRGSGIEYNLALLGMALALVLKGGGPWSVDRFLWKR
jgi:putative oxidoreductase